MHTRRDLIPNHLRIEEAIVHAQSQLPILFGHKHDRRRKGRDIMAKNSGIQHDLRRPLQLRLMMRSSRVAPASDGLHARLYPLGSHAGVRPQLVDCSSGCSRKKNNQPQSQAARPPRVRSRPSKPKRPPRPRYRRWSVYVADVRAPLLSVCHCLSISPVHVLPDATVLSLSISSKFPRLTGSLDLLLPSITKCYYSLPLSPFSVSLFYDFPDATVLSLSVSLLDAIPRRSDAPTTDDT